MKNCTFKPKLTTKSRKIIEENQKKVDLDNLEPCEFINP